MKKILIVVGTRPNFIKVTQFEKCVASHKDIVLKIVHTGQHYDEKMADVFFKQFNLVPDFFLNIPQVSANAQMAEIMLRLEKLVKKDFNPDLMVVVGDVNSTLAAAITANKLGIKLAHLESGLRSRDRTMPEEINRILTDEMTDYFFVTEQSGYENLIAEGKQEDQLFFVGNTMIDTLVAFDKEIKASKILTKLGVEQRKYVLLTMHRPATVDNQKGLEQLMELLKYIGETHKIVFPIHPRTLKNFKKFGLEQALRAISQVIISGPLDYFSFQKLIADSEFVVTDSGGIQEETTFRQVPCITLRDNTERPSTCEIGTNTLIAELDLEKIIEVITLIRKREYKTGRIPKLWEGRATERIMINITNDILSSSENKNGIPI